MEEYIRLEEEKARRRGKVYNWETATHGKIWYDEDVHDLRSDETEFSAIVFEGSISFDESDDEDYTIIFDKNSFSYKIKFVDNLKTDSKNDNEKINIPSFSIPEPTVSYFDDLNFLKDFENEFPAIVYNDALTSKLDSSIEPVEISHQPDKDNDDDKIDIKHSSRGNVINTDDGAYAHGSNKLLETSHDTSNKFFKTETFIKELNVKIDDLNITMEEYIRLEEEKARRRGKVYNWETATHGKIWYDEDVHDLRSDETEFSAIVFEGSISFDESDDEDYTIIFDKNSFSYKIKFVDNLKTDSKNDNEKINIPSFSIPEPTVSYFDDLNFLKDFENEFPAIVYNDALTSKLDSSIEPVEISHRIDEFYLKIKTSLSKCDKEEQNVLYFNDLFPFNVIYPDDSEPDKDNDDDKIDIKHSSRGNVINTDDGAYAHGSNKLLETSHDTSNKFFKTETFIKELNVNIVAWNYLNNRMILNFIKNLYVSFGIPFDPELFYKDGIKLGQV
nr:hypothetical protein [Tanacetum cinerariifolium]